MKAPVTVSGGERKQEAGAAVRRGPPGLWRRTSCYIVLNGGWSSLARATGLNRTGKSCRLRWLVVDLQSRWGDKWTKIAKHLPERMDNDVKNFWRTKALKKRNPYGGDTNATTTSAGASAEMVTTGSPVSSINTSPPLNPAA